ncbi:MAG TPA: ankyrin repeat domain-containing protein [Vicinamibacterales bacterium]|jgi:ankyrin repeat protein
MSIRLCSVVLVGLSLASSMAIAAATDPSLADAVKREDRAAVRALLRPTSAKATADRQKVDVNAPLSDGSTALHWAVESEDLETVGLLLDAGANVNAKNRYSVTPLHVAVSNGNAAIVGRLLKAGANGDAVDASGEPLLTIAVRGGSIDSLTLLLERGAPANAADTTAKETPLMWAVRAHQRDAIALLLSHGAHVNAVTRTGDTPPWVPPNAGGGSHGLGIVRGGWPERGARAAIPGGMTALLYAARDGGADVARDLLDAKAEVNQAEANGITPLLMAITNDRMDVARVLLERGADVNAIDFWGRTPLFAAVEIRNRDYTRNNEHGIDRAAALEMITTLLDKGANPNARTKEIPPLRRWVTPLGDLTWINMTGQTPFIRAAQSGDITTMKLLLARGADPTIATFGGTTALVTAAGGNVAVQQSFVESRESSMAAVKLCLELGIDVNSKNETGFTAVMGAANKGWDDILELLVKSGARLDVADKDGRTPLRWAKGEFIALHPPEEKPTTVALIEKLSK